MGKFKVDFSMDRYNTNSILFFSLFSAWLLSFPFFGYVLYGLYGKYSVGLENLSLIIIAALFIGHISAGYIIDDSRKAKKALVAIGYLCIVGSLVFYLPYSPLWSFIIIVLAFVGGVYVSIWGYYAKLYDHNLRIKAIALVLILSNIIMVFINIVSINISPFLGLGLSILCLLLS